jgi:hypothetical protein
MKDHRSPTPGDPAITRAARPVTVGWREYLAFPEWDIRRMKVKMDTGARTSALDVARCQLYSAAGGQVAELHVVVNARRPDQVRVVRAPVLGTVVVCNTGGVKEERPVVETTIRLGPVTKRVRLTITNRSAMRFRMILGRKALEHDFVVDVGKQYLLGRREKG